MVLGREGVSWRAAGRTPTPGMSPHLEKSSLCPALGGSWAPTPLSLGTLGTQWLKAMCVKAGTTVSVPSPWFLRLELGLTGWAPPSELSAESRARPPPPRPWRLVFFPTHPEGRDPELRGLREEQRPCVDETDARSWGSLGIETEEATNVRALGSHGGLLPRC